VNAAEPFSVRIDLAILVGLRARIAATRWSGRLMDGWDDGVDPACLHGLTQYWEQASTGAPRSMRSMVPSPSRPDQRQHALLHP
jgi:hypothetical protein